MIPVTQQVLSSSSVHTMSTTLRPYLFLTALLALCLGVLGQSCSSYGVDYSNGGSYYIDGSSDQYFTFISVFQGRRQRHRQTCLPGLGYDKFADLLHQAVLPRWSALCWSVPRATNMPARRSRSADPASRSARNGTARVS